MRNLIIVPFLLVSFALAGCGEKEADKKGSPSASISAEKAVYNQHAVTVNLVSCGSDEDCKAFVTFTDKKAPLQLERSFSPTCYSNSEYCQCSRGQFCSTNVVLKLNGKQYRGVRESKESSDSIGVITLTGIKQPTNLLTGEGELYGEEEIPQKVTPSEGLNP